MAPRSALSVALAENVQFDVGPMPRVRGDPLLITQLVQNLVANAIKFHKPGDMPVVRVEARREGSAWWVVSVVDNGIGIPRERMGLALCKRFVERRGGRIWVDPAPGEGAAFRFTLAEAST